MTSRKVLVLGQGVSGLTAALALLDDGHEVTIWSREAPGEQPHTSASAYAMWVPVRIDADPRIEQFADETLAWLTDAASYSDTGVTLRPIIVLKPEHSEPWYTGTAAGFRHARPDELPRGYQHAHVFERAPVIDPPVFLANLKASVEAAGGVFVQRTLQSFADCPEEFDAVVNCTGLGSRALAGDETLYGERVQVVTLRAGNFTLDRVIIDDEGPNKRSCIVPQPGYIKLGAVFNGNVESLEADRNATADILARACNLIPGLATCDILSVTCAHRPERPMPRLEVTTLADGRTLVHNYGHDGMGYILAWGVARGIAAHLA